MVRLHKEHDKADILGINRFSGLSKETAFWRYFISRVMYLSICLLTEQEFVGDIGLLIHKSEFRQKEREIQSLEDLQANWDGAFIGWQSSDGTFLLQGPPQIIGAEQYRCLQLPCNNETATKVYLVLKEETFAKRWETVVCKLLALLITNIDEWRSSFSTNEIYFANSSWEFVTSEFLTYVLGKMAQAVVNLGKKNTDNPSRHFCCILQPENQDVPIQQRTLVVRAQSSNSPHKIHKTHLVPSKRSVSIALKAYQSGGVIYWPDILSESDEVIAFQDAEKDCRSAIAIPIEGEPGEPVAVLYVASNERDAFPEEDQQVLRVIGRIIGELILTYRARHLMVENLASGIEHPLVVDEFFDEFLSENEFLGALEENLRDINEELKQQLDQGLLKKTFSLIAVDIDKQCRLANQYGDKMARNLIKQVGLRLRGQLRILLEEEIKLYRVYADRFYLVLDDVSQNNAREYARRIKSALSEDPYEINGLRIGTEMAQHKPDIFFSVRLGVISSSYAKMGDMLSNIQDTVNVQVVRRKLIQHLGETLRTGSNKGGNVVVALSEDTHQMEDCSSKPQETKDTSEEIEKSLAGPSLVTSLQAQDHSIQYLPDRCAILVGNQEKILTSLENRLAAYLFNNANRVCTLSELLEHVWGSEKKSSGVVEKAITRLRHRIEDDPKNPQRLKTIWGQGYELQIR